jgi:hypothetical protein
LDTELIILALGATALLVRAVTGSAAAASLRRRRALPRRDALAVQPRLFPCSICVDDRHERGFGTAAIASGRRTGIDDHFGPRDHRLGGGSNGHRD